MARSLSLNWWLLVLRGVLGILFGLAAFVWPGITLLTLIVMFGVYAIIFGVLLVVLGFRLRDWRAPDTPEPIPSMR